MFSSAAEEQVTVEVMLRAELIASSDMPGSSGAEETKSERSAGWRGRKQAKALWGAATIPSRAPLLGVVHR
jgi:hypothetical protein